MTLNNAQLAMIERVRSVGGGDLGIALSDEACAFLVCTMARDLGIDRKVLTVPADLPEFFSPNHPASFVIHGRDFLADLAIITLQHPDADSYFLCLAKLHKSRLKYQRILETQPIPTMDQVGPRGLLQYGQLSPISLSGLLYWRKWLFDIDNRAGQETGYLFEPIIALSIGGVPVSSKKSPVKRHADPRKGRQVDCVKGKLAYEIKLRVTIAASGQGRWREELDFPIDCRASGYKPVLVVLDPTENPKLAELVAAFKEQKGEVYVGEAAWQHLEKQAGPTMAAFLERYVRRTLRDLIDVADNPLPQMTIREESSSIYINIGGETLSIARDSVTPADQDEELPEDVDEEAGGP
jgi:hypothetical protein